MYGAGPGGLKGAKTMNLILGFYEPSENFARIREHICVMDTDSPGNRDGALIALFGPSRSGGATEAEAAESERQARQFIAAPDLHKATQALAHLVRAMQCGGVTEDLISDVLAFADAALGSSPSQERTD